MPLANKKIVPLTLIYLINNGEVLLLKRLNNKSMFPGQVLGLGGKIEPKEDLIASAQREFLEEAGLHINNLKLRGTYAWYDEDDDYGGTLYIFTSTSFTGELIKSDEGELFWQDINDLDNLKDQPEHQKLFLKNILTDNTYFFSGIARYNNGKIKEFSDNSSYFKERQINRVNKNNGQN